MRKVQFSPPDITQSEIDEVVDALKSGWITTGPKTKELERLVAQYSGTSKAVCLNSNTACSEMTLRVLGIKAGDEVIVPSYTYTATASIIEHVGATIVMVDCEPGKFTWDYDKLEEAITEKTKVIIPVDLFGIPADYDRIMSIVEKKKSLFKPSNNKIQQALGRCIVMTDGAHCFGAKYKGKPVATYTDFINYSFHAVKNLTTAEGGAVTWRDIKGIDNEEIYHKYMLLSLHGQSKDALAKTQLGAWEYDIVGPWYKCNMTDVHAAIGLGQIRRYDSILSRRKEIIEKYNKAFLELPLELVKHYSDSYESSGHLYVVRLFDKSGDLVDSEIRNKFITKMAEFGVGTNVHYKPLPMHTAYKNLGFDINNYPNAYEQFQNTVTLPLHTCMSDEDVEYVINCVKKVFKEILC
ncbi:DegT/DnrJ/EryC1/StrS family aminotransferase [Clostridium perfringens]|uniref:DegT/DnrJ/EryC1/StrS family aminotransferase n=1 Tax=Clostridium perfringens TaxID=1502 RepID=UPI001C85E0DB|nr:DegT/DnrJ/EryC1/StrS family aminotransferase [Clostridium perfringens]MDB2059895.1 DegT/DnrJ/EryC1/StrS family aminotransferase [Clostridium perfringens]MDB2062861.1 DegT/DnrJ/EryC1/StrS family aminotransferase [Clostridium perfringens]MDB2065445.1 DegT/DnrJ/EryC1/StrS family aminotransferase [Clostridium perfringens]MDK0571556.1 DegT/DnrJ/EryC1/StrS family aminotransferase [Clostridium perfringens]MDK0629687.1 DegT/DnrJ/EryC1/StrS family aminotransferase [Clostridium perfringens]